MDTHLIPLPRLQEAVRLVVRGFGSSAAEVEAVASNLIEANLTGHDSHGVGMLPRYAQAYLTGGLKPNTHVRVLQDHGAMLRLDGDAGFGQVIGHEAMALGIERARAHGTCVVALGNSHHLGRIGAWAEQVADAGLVSLHFVNVIARAIVAPHGGADARFGTNPFCAGVPVPGRPHVIVDFATSTIAQGKTRVAHNKGEPVPPGSLLDDQGRETTDPRWSVVPPYGALMAFGGHKGYALALLCELLGGALAAGNTQNTDAGEPRVLNGMFSVLIDAARLAEPAAFAAETERFVAWLQAGRVREGFDAVKLAGDPERENRARRSIEGVPVDATTWQEIRDAAVSLGVAASEVDRLAGLA